MTSLVAASPELAGKLRALIRDVRALRYSAVLRAAYEVSKRTNMHAVFFRSMQAPARHESVPLHLGTRIPKHPLARARCLADAAAVANEGVRVFGRRAPTGVTESWFTDPLTSERWPSGTAWWRIDIRSERRLSDVKFVWEAARHRDLVVLARAAVLDGDGPWQGLLESMLRRWCAECPPESGVNWYSSLELALRAIAWSQVMSLVGPRLPHDLRRDLDAQLLASARHIILELPYTLSSMKNNHMLGDGLGLIVLSRMFPSHPRSVLWERVGNRLFNTQLARHMRVDGSMIEDSLSYHRFVLEMLIVRVLVGDSPIEVRRALEGAAEHLYQLGALDDGPLPQFGDWDEGRVLTDSAVAGSVAGSTWAGFALSGVAIPEARWDEYDELAWYCEPPDSDSNVTTSRRSRELSQLPPIRRSGDWIVCQHGSWVTWFKVGTGPSHQHADVTSVFTRRRHQWVVRDPGTGTYNGPLSVRNGFRASSAHPVWVPGGEDQLRPHRAFRWLGSLKAISAGPVQVGDVTVFACWHDAFRDSHDARVARVLLVGHDGVAVIDAVDAPGQHTWCMNIPLGDPGAAHLVSGFPDAEFFHGQSDPFRGWHSDTYGTWAPSTWLGLESKLQEPGVWIVGPGGPDGQSSLRVRADAVRLRWCDRGLLVVVGEGSKAVELRVFDV